MLLGYPPFYSEEHHNTLKKVINHKKYFKIPAEANISKEAIDIMQKLITTADKRLGNFGVAEIKAHPFFKGIDWKNIRS